MLHISADHTRIENADGSRFFYLADTGWELAHWLTREEAEIYLTTRARQGFTVIQMMALIEHDGLRAPNRCGQVPFHDLDPDRPNEAYWEYVDVVIRRANALGMHVALLPTWGDKVLPMWGIGPVVFDEAKARRYGEWIGRRYVHDDVIWVIGGDRPVQEARDLGIWNALAAGVRAAVGAGQIMTFHPNGRASSSSYVHDQPWLDFNMLQSGHGPRKDQPNWNMIARDLALEPKKPVLDGEPNYEEHPVMGDVDGRWTHVGGRFDDHDVRKTAYRSVLAGACGYTYGCHAVWQFYDPALRPAINKPFRPWRDSLELSGANQVRHVKAFVRQLDAWGGIRPCQGLLSDGMGDAKGEQQMVAAALAQRSGLVLYTPVQQNLRLPRARHGRFAPAAAWWFDPRTGAWSAAEVKTGALLLECVPPTNDDYALVIGDATLPPPAAP